MISFSHKNIASARHLSLAKTLEPHLPNHQPHQRYVARRYKQHKTSGAYASRLPAALIQRCGLWIHGHSHDSVNQRFGDAGHETRVISNPRGYRMLWLDDPENARFDPGLTVNFPWPKLLEPAPGST